MKKYFITLQIFTAGSLILSAQNVGIGTITPSEKLHVAGNIKSDTVKPSAIKFTPNAAAGKVLTSDAAGNANWQTNNGAAASNLGFGVWGDCATNGNISDYNPVADPEASPFDFFGYSVSISGNFAIVGSYLDDIGSNFNQGSASIFQYNGANWVFMQKLTDPAGLYEDYFGQSVAISGNYAIVGAYGDDEPILNQGSASIYHYNGSSWVFMQKLTDPAAGFIDYFGFSVSISGDFAVVGSYWDDVGSNGNQGSALVYHYNGSNWVFMQKILDPTGASGDFFGTSVSISGSYMIVGADYDAVGTNPSQGSACIYQYNGADWAFMQKLTDATGGPHDYFGNSVSISGNLAIVGAYLDDVGSNADQGSVSIYQYDGTNWVLMEKIIQTGGLASDYFGKSVSVSGDYAMVTAHSDDVGSNLDQGSATVYVRVGLGWQKLQYVTDPSGKQSELFGLASQIDGSTKRIIIGAPYYANSSGKVVFGKVN